jgi:hypothetical protein
LINSQQELWCFIYRCLAGWHPHRKTSLMFFGLQNAKSMRLSQINIIFSWQISKSCKKSQVSILNSRNSQSRNSNSHYLNSLDSNSWKSFWVGFQLNNSGNILSTIICISHNKVICLRFSHQRFLIILRGLLFLSKYLSDYSKNYLKWNKQRCL